MGKTAFLFSGQGAQKPGMGQDLAAASAAAQEVFAMADSLRPGTTNMCAVGPAEELNQTRNTQPCLFCTDLAAACALRAAGIQADGVAGFSLGEIAALTFAGYLSPEDGFRLVCARAQCMDHAAQETPSAMVAVLRLDNQVIEDLCHQFDGVYPVNYNCPGQLVVAGKKEQLPSFCQAAKQAGGRTVELAVSGGFHSPMMQSAAQALEEELKHFSFVPGKIPLYSNVTAHPYGGNSPQELLTRQLVSPVLWQQTITNMIADGFDTFIEVGVGKTLMNFVKKIDKTVSAYVVEDVVSYQETVAALQGGTSC